VLVGPSCFCDLLLSGDQVVLMCLGVPRTKISIVRELRLRELWVYSA